MSGLYSSELLDGQGDATSWESLYTPAQNLYEPEFTSSAYAVPDAPIDYVVGNAPAFPEYAPAAGDIYSDAVAAPGYGDTYEDGSGPVAPELPYADPFQEYQPAPYQGDPFQQYAPAPYDWAPQPTGEDLAQSEGLQEYLFGDPMNVAPEWYESKGMPYHPSQLDPWEAPSNFSTDEAFSTISGDDIGGGRGTTGMFNPEAQLDPSQVQDRRYLGGDRLLNPDFGGQAMNQGRRGAEIILDALGINPFGNTRPVNPYQVVNPETGEPLDPSIYNQFGFGATGQPLNSASRSILSNPQFAESNAQFDYTTNPENMQNTSLLEALGNLGSAAVSQSTTFRDLQTTFGDAFQEAGNLLDIYRFQPPNSSGITRPPEDNIVGDIARVAGESLVPTTPLEGALMVAPGLGKIGGEGASVATRGYGMNADNLPDVVGGAKRLLELPSGYGATFGPQGMPGDDAVRKFVQEALESNPGQIADDIARLRAAGVPDEDILNLISQQANDLGAAARRLGAEAAEQAPPEPITDLRGQLREDLGIGSGPTQPSMLDEVPPDLRPSLNISGRADDVIDAATEQWMRSADNWPAATPGSQPGLFSDEAQAFMEEAAGPAYYAPGQGVPAGRRFELSRQRLAGREPLSLTDNPNASPLQMREQPTAIAMQDAGGAANYAPGAMVEPPSPSLNALKLARIAQENPSSSNLVAAVDAALPKVAGQLKLLDSEVMDSRTLWQRAVDELIGLIGLPRQLKASFDMSIPGRQGLALAFRHPKEWAQSWSTWAKSMQSEEGFRLVNRDAENTVTRWKQFVGDDGVIHLNTIDRNAPATERIAGFEAKNNSFIANVGEKLGTGKFERSAVAFINSQRAKTMDTMFTSLWNAGERNPQVYRNLAAIIDHATGYGAAPLKGDIASRLFFSQRFMTSRFQFLVDPIVEGVARGDMNAARAATENLVAFAGGQAALLGILYMGLDQAGVDVEWDPRSADFGKIRVGPQRIDFGAGFLPLIRSIAQIGTGEKKTLTGDVVPLQKFDMDTMKKGSRVSASGGVAVNFFRNKLDPVTGEIVTRIAGKDPVGNAPTQLLSFSTFENMFAPLIASSIHETLANGGQPWQAATTGAAEFFGGSGSTYNPGQAAQQDTSQQRYGVDYGRLPAPYQAEINAGIPNIEIGDRLSPWWQSRDNAVQYLQSQLTGQENDPRYDAIAAAKSYQDVQIGLQRVYEGEYGMNRIDAEKEVASLMRTLFEDNIDKYRHDVMAADPGFAKAWFDAYNARQTKYEPPKWVKDLARGQ